MINDNDKMSDDEDCSGENFDNHNINEIPECVQVQRLDPDTLQLTDEIDEFDIEDDATVLLNTIRLQYPTMTSLKFRNEATGSSRTLKVVNDKIQSPNDEIGWNRLFQVVLPIGASTSSLVKSSTSGTTKRRRESRSRDRKSRSPKRSRREPIDLLLKNISFGTSEDDLHSYFSEFGDLKLCELKKNDQGKSRGFAFLRFKTIEGQRKAVRTSHELGGRTIMLRRPHGKGMEDNQNRLFIARVLDSDKEEDFEEYFNMYGKILDMHMPTKCKGFAFITFENPDSVAEILDDGIKHEVNGHTVTVAIAQPKNKDLARTGGDRSGRDRDAGRGDRDRSDRRERDNSRGGILTQSRSSRDDRSGRDDRNRHMTSNMFGNEISSSLSGLFAAQRGAAPMLEQYGFGGLDPYSDPYMAAQQLARLYAPASTSNGSGARGRRSDRSPRRDSYRDGRR